jgi:Uma2 family endonuclease
MRNADAALDERRLLTRSEYDQLVNAGVFEDERVELIYGEILAMAPIGADHESVVDLLTELLVLALSSRARVRVQSSIAIADHSQPEPDLLLLDRGDYSARRPTTAYLAIEVASSSLRRDRGPKVALYAEAKIPEYWIVNLVDKIVEVHTEIVGGTYARVTPYRSGEQIRLQAFPDTELAVADFLR